jgi:hypothetical protein
MLHMMMLHSYTPNAHSEQSSYNAMTWRSFSFCPAALHNTFNIHSHYQSAEEGTVGDNGMRPCYPSAIELLTRQHSLVLRDYRELTEATTSPSLRLEGI